MTIPKVRIRPGSILVLSGGEPEPQYWETYKEEGFGWKLMETPSVHADLSVRFVPIEIGWKKQMGGFAVTMLTHMYVPEKLAEQAKLAFTDNTSLIRENRYLKEKLRALTTAVKMASSIAAGE